MGATGTSTASRKAGVVLRVLCGGGEWVRGTLWGDSRVVSWGNVVVRGDFCRGAIVDSWRSLVQAGIFPGDVVVSGVFLRVSRVV